MGFQIYHKIGEQGKLIIFTSIVRGVKYRRQSSLILRLIDGPLFLLPGTRTSFLLVRTRASEFSSSLCCSPSHVSLALVWY
jgi:hypothetical protein